jgi:hypothetical protein
MVGGIPVGILIGGVAGYIIARAIKLLRLGTLMAGEKSSRVQKLSGNIFIRIIMRLLFGKQKKTIAEMLGMKHPILRKSGLIFCAVLVGLFLGFQAIFLDDIAKSALVTAVEAAAGAEVNVEGVNLSLTDGKFTMEGMQVTDRANPTHNSYTIAKLSTSISMTELLTKRVVIDKILIGEMTLGEKRDSPGEVYRPVEEAEEPKGPFNIGDYFENSKQILDYLKKIKEYLEEQEKNKKDPEERSPAETKEQAKELAKKLGYLKASAANLLVERPTITIRRLEVAKIPVDQLGNFKVEATELSNNLALNEKPATLKVTSDKDFDGSATLDFVNKDARHALKIIAPNLPVAALGLSDKCPVDISEALADIDFNGTFSSKDLKMPLVLKVHGMKSAMRGDKGIFGLDAATSQEIFKNITEMTLSADVHGTMANPQLKVDAGKTLAGLKDTLLAAGKAQLANMAGAQLKKVLADVPIPGVGDLLDGKLPTSNPADILKGAGDLLDGKLPTSNPADILKGAGDLLKTPGVTKPDGGESKNPLDLLKRVTDGDPKETEGDDTKTKDPVGGVLDKIRL